ncbi:flagellar hook-associated family protein [Limoniibacter endophyticus]|uniref:Flagellin n=1 Tax=Limoniibacter endophyticus TaxID=1565040 RepID=A0A8J3GGB2_9HYPH|nr:flagellar hook-associated family protein [Limoniibacter endophyticus]GHC64481.1 flagellin [Limoniibacter endophyticus]
MKASYVSSSAISEALRYSLSRMQKDLVQNQQEATLGRHADVGLALGASTGQAVSLRRDTDRLNSLLNANSQATNRLEATQASLTVAQEASTKFLTTLTAATGGNVHRSVLAAEAKSTLAQLTDALNTSINGQFIFAGINTDAKPVADFNDPNSQARQAFETAFETRFGFAMDDPQVATIPAEDIVSFVDTEVNELFMGDGWGEHVSSASDQLISARISLNETADVSVSANEDAIRQMMMGVVTITLLADTPLSTDAMKAVTDRSLEQFGGVVGEIGQLQSRTGIIQNRVNSASTRVESQVQVFQAMTLDLESVDPYEAATKVNDLLTQIDVAYALTARIQNLSLLNHLR